MKKAWFMLRAYLKGDITWFSCKIYMSETYSSIMLGQQRSFVVTWKVLRSCKLIAHAYICQKFMCNRGEYVYYLFVGFLLQPSMT